MDLDVTFSSFKPQGDFHYYNENAPPGYHFDDKDDHVMISYVRSKERGDLLANTLFKEVELYNYSPDDLQRKFNKGKGDELYLYTRPKQLNNGSRVERKAGNGYWRNSKQENIQGGYKSTFTYFTVNNGIKKKTCWNMHEYRLKRQNSKRKVRDDVVLCKIYKPGAAGKTGKAVDEENNEETDGSIGSCNSLHSSTTASNGLGQNSPDVPTPECFKTEDLVTHMNGSGDLKDRSQFVVSQIEDFNDHLWLEGCLLTNEELKTSFNDCGDFTMADNGSFHFGGSQLRI